MMELPVRLIQSLQDRQAWLQAELEHLAAIRAHETLVQTELSQIETLLASYPVSIPAQVVVETSPPVPAQEEMPCGWLDGGREGG